MDAGGCERETGALCFSLRLPPGQQAGVACRLPLGWLSPLLTFTLLLLSRAVLGNLCGCSLVRGRPCVGRQAFARLHIIFG